MADIQLKETIVIGTKYIHRFKTDSGDIDVETDEKGFMEHREIGAPQPSYKGAAWVQSFTKHIFDTPSGELEEQCYYKENETFVSNDVGKITIGKTLDALREIK